MRETQDIENALQSHGRAIWRACAVYFPAGADAEDAYQETFLKYSLAENIEFREEEHRKAWLIRVATNVCKDMLKAAERKNIALDEELAGESLMSRDSFMQPGSALSDVADALRSLDDPPRTPLYLSVCEEYSAPEIAEIMDAPLNTVYSWISRGKKMLKEVLS